MNMTNDNKLPIEVATMQPQAPPPPNEVFIRVGTTLYKVVDQPTINGGKVRKRIPWNMETLRQDYGKEFIKYVHKYDGFCTVPEHVNHRNVIDGFLNLYEPISHKTWHRISFDHQFLPRLLLNSLWRSPFLPMPKEWQKRPKAFHCLQVDHNYVSLHAMF